MKLLLDEQISGRVAVRLRDQGYDVSAVAADADLRGRTDREVFEFAQAQERAVVTYDREDFEAIFRGYLDCGRRHHGLVVVPSKRLPNGDWLRQAE